MSIKSELNIIASNVLSKVRATGDKESTLSLTKLANNFGLDLSLIRDAIAVSDQIHDSKEDAWAYVDALKNDDAKEVE